MGTHTDRDMVATDPDVIPCAIHEALGRGQCGEWCWNNPGPNGDTDELLALAVIELREIRDMLADLRKAGEEFRPRLAALLDSPKVSMFLRMVGAR